MSVVAQISNGSGMTDAVEAAIARVLAAETAARADVLRAGEEAHRSDEHARSATRAIMSRSAARIAGVRAAFARRADLEESALAREAQALTAAPALSDADRTMLARAVHILAGQLTGEAP